MRGELHNGEKEERDTTRVIGRVVARVQEPRGSDRRGRVVETVDEGIA
jgi:hypothetical protein